LQGTVCNIGLYCRNNDNISPLFNRYRWQEPYSQRRIITEFTKTHKTYKLMLEKKWLTNIKNNNWWLCSSERKQIFALMMSFVSSHSFYSLIFNQNCLCRKKDRISISRILCVNKSAIRNVINVGCFKPTLSRRTAVRKRTTLRIAKTLCTTNLPSMANTIYYIISEEIICDVVCHITTCFWICAHK